MLRFKLDDCRFVSAAYTLIRLESLQLAEIPILTQGQEDSEVINNTTQQLFWSELCLSKNVIRLHPRCYSSR